MTTWQIPLKLPHTRNPQSRKTETPKPPSWYKFEFKLVQDSNLNLYCEIRLTRSLSFLMRWISGIMMYLFNGICHTVCVCVCVCVALFCWPDIGEIAVPASFLKSGDLGWPDSAPSTLTTSLAIPVPSSSSSNGPTTTPLTTRGLCPGSSVVWAGPKFVRTHQWGVSRDRTSRSGANPRPLTI